MPATSVRAAGPCLAAALAAVLVLGDPGPAMASCAVPPPLPEAIAAAQLVFVGTVDAVRDETIAHFRVEEIWVGPDLTEVTIHGGEGGGTVTSVDRSFVAGQRYLVLPYADGATLRDNACTNTQVWTDELAELRPADARTVDPATADGSPEPAGRERAFPVWLLAALGVGGATLLGGAWGFTRRRR